MVAGEQRPVVVGAAGVGAPALLAPGAIGLGVAAQPIVGEPPVAVVVDRGYAGAGLQPLLLGAQARAGGLAGGVGLEPGDAAGGGLAGSGLRLVAGERGLEGVDGVGAESTLELDRGGRRDGAGVLADQVDVEEEPVGRLLGGDGVDHRREDLGGLGAGEAAAVHEEGGGAAHARLGAGEGVVEHLPDRPLAAHAGGEGVGVEAHHLGVERQVAGGESLAVAEQGVVHGPERALLLGADGGLGGVTGRLVQRAWDRGAVAVLVHREVEPGDPDVGAAGEQGLEVARQPQAVRALEVLEDRDRDWRVGWTADGDVGPDGQVDGGRGDHDPAGLGGIEDGRRWLGGGRRGGVGDGLVLDDHDDLLDCGRLAVGEGVDGRGEEDDADPDAELRAHVEQASGGAGQGAQRGEWPDGVGEQGGQEDHRGRGVHHQAVGAEAVEGDEHVEQEPGAEAEAGSAGEGGQLGGARPPLCGAAGRDGERGDEGEERDRRGADRDRGHGGEVGGEHPTAGRGVAAQQSRLQLGGVKSDQPPRPARREQRGGGEQPRAGAGHAGESTPWSGDRYQPS